MLEPIFVDTAFVLALINQRDQYHEQAVLLADQYEQHPFVITDGILLEIGNALSRTHRTEAVATIQHFLTSDDVETIRLTPQLFDEALSFYSQHQDKSWGLVDCLSFVVMNQLHIRHALTFDQHFKQAGFFALLG